VKVIKPKGGGRPKYVLDKKDYEIIKKMMEFGISVNSLASYFGIARSTLFDMLKRDKEFSDHVKA
jgi:hypothetical protein